ncbi:calmodulin calcium-dependent NAD kinase-like [Aristolochia californica]|uniref:calmodulin calcium-dependent NAD kinase-like n=1 Tax=Aristolochia californica TaxID=171875 RepID=UPI0035DC4462
MGEGGGNGRLIVLQIVAVSSFAFLSAACAIHLRRRLKRAMRDRKPVPRLVLTKSGRVDKLEAFSSYVARQLGFAGVSECPHVGKLAYDYLRKVKGGEDNIYSFFASDPDADALYMKLLDELDRCILGYFAYHWSHASQVIAQILDADSHKQKKLRDIVLAATRKQRFEKVTKDLKVTRLFSTLLEEMRAIGKSFHDESECTEVMVPAALSERSPMLLLMGGGMGAGKSTVLKDVLKDPFWSEAAKNAVVVEADAFKETDVIYRALSSRGEHHDMLQTAELVHQSSTDAASSLLVTALNEGRDVILDSTLSWEPFVEQTITMARNVHRHRYRMGLGYKVCDDGTIIEDYWEKVEERPEEAEERGKNKRKPYRIELVGVVSDAYLAVVRGIRRAILMRRAVRVKSQLKSHKSFAKSFPRYCQLVDTARLFCTNSMGGPPKLIGWKEGSSQLLVDPEEIDCLKRVSLLNEEASSVDELYRQDDPVNRSGCVWFDVVLAPSRAAIQEQLKLAIQRTENQLLRPQAQNQTSL